MKALLLKEWGILRLPAPLFLAAAAYLVFISKSDPFLPVLLISLGVIFNSLAIDDRYRIDSLLCSLPVTRRQIVRARYLAAFLAIVMVTLLTWLLIGMRGLFFSAVQSPQPSGWDLLRELALTYSFLLMFISLLLPLYFKFGTQLEFAKGRMIMVVVALLAVLMTWPIVFFSLSIRFPLTPRNLALVAALALALTCLSERLAARLYSRRDL